MRILIKLASTLAFVAGMVAMPITASAEPGSDAEGWYDVECSVSGGWGVCVYYMNDGRMVVVQGPVISV